VLAAVALAVADDVCGRAAREREVKQAVKTVAAYLGNTPAVCRASYVDPRVIDRFHAGVTISSAIGEGGPDLSKARVRARVERAVLELLEDTTRR
jgi:DNA topoisomerase IB